MKDRNRSLKDSLGEILEGYGFETGPLFNLAPKLRLHTALAYKYSFLEKDDSNKIYIEKTLEKASHVFKELDFQGDLLLVYDIPYNKNPQKEISFIESRLINIKAREDYSYDWLDESKGEICHSRRIIYQVEAFKTRDIFLQISLSDFAGDYDLVSSIYIIDLKSKSIFYFYDDRGIYIMARKEKILNDLWEALPGYFFEDCHDFEIKIRKLYWPDGGEGDFKDLCLEGELEIRLNDQIVKSSCLVGLAGLRLLRSIFDGHKDSTGKHLFPSSRDRIGESEKGLDWSVSHKNGLVTIEAHENLRTSYYYLQYKKEVLSFIGEVENFYNAAGRRTLPKDETLSKAYLDFWREWEALKEKASLT